MKYLASQKSRLKYLYQHCCTRCKITCCFWHSQILMRPLFRFVYCCCLRYWLKLTPTLLIRWLINSKYWQLPYSRWLCCTGTFQFDSGLPCCFSWSASFSYSGRPMHPSPRAAKRASSSDWLPLSSPPSPVAFQGSTLRSLSNTTHSHCGLGTLSWLSLAASLPSLPFASTITLPSQKRDSFTYVLCLVDITLTVIHTSFYRATQRRPGVSFYCKPSVDFVYLWWWSTPIIFSKGSPPRSPSFCLQSAAFTSLMTFYRTVSSTVAQLLSSHPLCFTRFDLITCELLFTDYIMFIQAKLCYKE